MAPITAYSKLTMAKDASRLAPVFTNIWTEGQSGDPAFRGIGTKRTSSDRVFSRFEFAAHCRMSITQFKALFRMKKSSRGGFPQSTRRPFPEQSAKQLESDDVLSTAICPSGVCIRTTRPSSRTGSVDGFATPVETAPSGRGTSANPRRMSSAVKAQQHGSSGRASQDPPPLDYGRVSEERGICSNKG
jgi:hypothetical protein